MEECTLCNKNYYTSELTNGYCRECSKSVCKKCNIVSEQIFNGYCRKCISIPQAKELRKISDNATKKIFEDFKCEYEEFYYGIKVYIVKELNKLANNGFCKIIDLDIDNKIKQYELNQEEKDILSNILKNELESLEYKIKVNKDNKWIISF